MTLQFVQICASFCKLLQISCNIFILFYYSIFFSPLGKPADRAMYFTFRNFFYFFCTMSKAISVSTGQIFTIFTPNGRYLREFS